jgi:gamma-glutamylputrescine oxidase
MAKTFATEFEYWPRERVAAALSAPHYSEALFNPGAYSIHPLNLNRGLARAATQRGARVFEGSPALALSKTGDYKQVRTSHGRIRSGTVIIACGGYVDRLQPKVSGATIPIASFVMATEPLGERLKSAIRVPYAVFDNAVATNYYRPLSDTRILWGGRVLAWQPRPSRIAALLKRDMIAHYPSLRGARVEVAWGGMMPFTRHGLPVIGQVEPGVWYATGFGGLGIVLTTTIGRLLAAAIAEGDEQWQLFENFGLPFAGGKFGKVPAQLFYWRHRLTKWLASH